MRRKFLVQRRNDALQITFRWRIKKKGKKWRSKSISKNMQKRLADKKTEWIRVRSRRKIVYFISGFTSQIESCSSNNNPYTLTRRPSMIKTTATLLLVAIIDLRVSAMEVSVYSQWSTCTVFFSLASLLQSALERKIRRKERGGMQEKHTQWSRLRAMQWFHWRPHADENINCASLVHWLHDNMPPLLTV